MESLEYCKLGENIINIKQVWRNDITHVVFEQYDLSGERHVFFEAMPAKNNKYVSLTLL